jgi:PiT family inorganic phosphate transporter
MVDHEFDAIFIVACIAAFFLSMGIGANDVSNSLGVTVASGIISINKAMLIASVFEFLGAVTLGRGVSRTVLSIVDNACFESTPQRYGVGLVSVIMGAGGWLVIATRTGLPVSATHSTIGAMLGFGLVSTGYACIQWVTLLPVVLGWIFSPAIAAGAALGLYYILNSVFRSPEDHVLIRNRGKKALYILIWISLFA